MYIYIDIDKINNVVLYQLVDTELGGELVFPAVPAVIKPRAGSMVVWRDTDITWENDFKTLHGACPVVMGEKWSKRDLSFFFTFTDEYF